MSREPEPERNPFVQNSNENENQPANRLRPPAARPASLSEQSYRDNPLAAGDIEGGTAKTEEEYKKSDDLTQENENPQVVRTEILFLPPASVDPVRLAASQKIENRALQLRQSTFYPSSTVLSLGPPDDGVDTVLSLRPPGVAVETKYNRPPTSDAVDKVLSLGPPSVAVETKYNRPPPSVAAQKKYKKPPTSVAAETRYSRPPTNVAPPAQSSLSAASPHITVQQPAKTEKCLRPRAVAPPAQSSLPGSSRGVAPPAQSSLPGPSSSGASTSGKRVIRNLKPRIQTVQPYRCKFCQQAFYTMQTLQVHIYLHSDEIIEENQRARNHIRETVRLFQSMFPEFGSPSQIQRQISETPTPSPRSLQSQSTAQQGPFYIPHRPPPSRRNLGHPRGNSNPDLNIAPGDRKPEALSAINIQNRPLRADTTGCNQQDMVPTTSTRTQDPQPHDQPQLMHSDPKSGVGASMQRNYPYSLAQGMAPSPSLPVTVTQGGFDPSFQRHHQPQVIYSGPNLGVGEILQRNFPYSLGQVMGALSSSLPVTVTQGGFDPSFQHHHQLQLNYSDPNSSGGARMQRNYPDSFGQGMASSSSLPLTVTQAGFNPSFQRHHHQPQLMHSDPNSAVGTSMQRNYAGSSGQGMASSSSLPVTVTQAGFNPSFQRHHQQELMHSDPNSGVAGASIQRNYPYSFGQGMASSSLLLLSPATVTQMIFNPSFQRHHQLQRMHSDQLQRMQRNYPYFLAEGMASSSSSPVAVTQGGLNPNFQLQNPRPIINSRVNQDPRLANVPGTIRGLAPASQFQAAPRRNSQEHINAVAREVINVSSPYSNPDIDASSSSN